MRKLAILALTLSSTLTACATSDTDAPDTEQIGDAVTAAATKIQVTATSPLTLVAYRDASDPVWHTAVEKSPTRFVASVHGNYWVTTVCETDTDFGGGFVVHFVQINQFARTLGDGTSLNSYCTKADTKTRNVSGTMYQPGRVVINGNWQSSLDPNWPYQIAVAPGVHTLYARTDARVVIRRGVDATRNVKLSPINTNTEGANLASFVFGATNADPDATVNAAVRIEQQADTFPGAFYYGPAQTATLIPTNLLTDDDNQTVSVISDVYRNDNGAQRDISQASRRPFRIGDDATYTLPPQIAATWAFEGGANPVVRWTALPLGNINYFDYNGNTTLNNDSLGYSVDLSPAFLTATGITSVGFDTSFPGFDPAWQIDYSLYYNRDAITQSYTDPLVPEHGRITTSEVLDTIDPSVTALAKAATPVFDGAPRPTRAAK